jgi:predicted ATPase/DNA-binding XRE family transcriptional regulator
MKFPVCAIIYRNWAIYFNTESDTKTGTNGKVMQEEISFGTWLRKQRRALDLSQKALADQVGCAEVTLRRIEAGRLKPSKELAKLLLEKLGISETEWPQWISFARGLAVFPSDSAPPSNKPKSNLPAGLTTFIGREKEQSEILRLLAKHRLLTLTGPGGVGKTRLSLKVGEQVLESYAAGVWLVELAPILDPVLIPRTTAIAIGLRDEPQRPVIDMLSDYLREKQMLLILDNCEHLLASSAQLADTLLKRCPELKILATSREALGILGEAVYAVPSLQLPDITDLIEKFRDYESIRLFEGRAQLARIDFSLTIENAPSIAKICSQVDGIPLAIELAAARISTLSTEQIAMRLQENFGLLSTGNRTALPRHQTLQAAIDWSHELLLTAEQTLFRRLSVFVNGWTLEAAQSTCSDANINSEAILNLLTQLIKKSLVNLQEGNGKIRYRMLEPVRQYANEKLIEAGEDEALHDRHLESYLNLAVTAEPHLIRLEQLEWLSLLDYDYENIRFALEWALRKEETTKQSLSLCSALLWFWEIRGYWLEGLNWVKRALAKSSQNVSESEKIARTRALATCAMLEWQLSQRDEMQVPAETSLALALETSNKKDIAIGKLLVGAGLRLRGNIDNQAYVFLEQSYREFQELDEPFWKARSFQMLGSLLADQAKIKNSDLYLQNLEHAREAGERSNLADCLSAYAEWLFTMDRVDEAREYIEESDKLYKQIGSEKTSLNSSLRAAMAWSNGEYQSARSLYLELYENFNLLGQTFFASMAFANLGLISRDEGDLREAQEYLEQAHVMFQRVGNKVYVALNLFELSNLCYVQGNLEAFKQNFRKGFALKSYFDEYYKVYMLVIALNSLYTPKPEITSRFLGLIDKYEKGDYIKLTPIERKYQVRAETYARKTLGDVAFKRAFGVGQNMPLDEALDLALKTVEEM